MAGQITFINSRALQMMGQPETANLIGQNPHTLFHHSHTDGTPYAKEDCPIQRALHLGGEILLQNETFFRADGSTFCGEYRSKPIIVEGILTGAVVSVLDVTQEMRAKELEALHRAELGRVLESMSDAYFSTDQHGIVLSSNTHQARALGLPTDASLGQHVNTMLDVMAPQNRQLLQRAMAEASTTQQAVHVEGHDAATNRWSATGIYPKPDQGLAVFTADITARKQAEQAIIDNAHKLKVVFDSSPAAMALWCGDSLRLELSNPLFAAHFPGNGRIGQSASQAVQEATPGSLMATVARVQHTRQTHTTTEIRSSADEAGSMQHRHFDCICVPVLDKQGRLYGIFAHAVDVTARVNTKVALQAQAQKLAESVSELHQERDFRDNFVATLTHDLRSPIASAKLKAQTLARRLRDDDRAAASLARITAAMERANRMIENLLDASRIKAGDGIKLTPEPGHIDKIVDGVVNDARAQHGERFVVHNATGAIPGHWDTFAVQRVLENLLTNALKYGVPEKPITTSITAASGWVDVSVHNSGNPIPEEDQPTLFEPYRRTESAQRSAQKGWGLGLTLVKGITEAHGGAVEVQSSEAEGTTFKLRLPVDSRK